MSTALAAPLDYRAKINPRPQFYLLSPADIRLECDVRAETFVFPATDEIACEAYSHPVDPRRKINAEGIDPLRCRADIGYHTTKCPWHDTQMTPIPGVLPIRELAGALNPKGGQMLNGMTAQEVVLAIIGVDGIGGKLGKHGIRILFGDERDEQVREEATLAYREAKYRMALATKASHLSINAKQVEAGLPLIPPAKATMAAMDFIVKYETQFNPSSKFQCGECAYPFHEKRDRDAHIAVHHREKAAKYGVTAQAAGPEGFTPATATDLVEGVAKETVTLLLNQVAELTAKVQEMQQAKPAQEAPRGRRGR